MTAKPDTPPLPDLLVTARLLSEKYNSIQLTTQLDLLMTIIHTFKDEKMHVVPLLNLQLLAASVLQALEIRKATDQPGLN